MTGNHAQGIKARDKNLAKNPNFYRDIGRMAHNRGGGFALMSYEKLAEISAKGGRKSRLRKKTV